ncbi:unnamed protein product [Soboliphyme baturini]|uniref:Uncharacterized protein n=1 Tax=Soboliphyme baturini TaxID=241478 RepID=A0A183J1R7_9BILA|nr:unnamed protein product [Soboliphyme baturini]
MIRVSLHQFCRIKVTQSHCNSYIMSPTPAMSYDTLHLKEYSIGDPTLHARRKMKSRMFNRAALFVEQQKEAILPDEHAVTDA